MGKSIYLSRAEFSKISGVSQQSLSNMFKRFTAGIETKYHFSESGEIILNQIEYNRLVDLLKEKEKSEIVNSVQEKKSDIIINNFSSEIQDLIKIFEKRFNTNDKFGKEILENYNLQLQKYKEYVFLYYTKTFLCENKLNEIIGETGEISDKITHLLSIRSFQISTLSLEEILKRK